MHLHSARITNAFCTKTTFASATTSSASTASATPTATLHIPLLQLELLPVWGDWWLELLYALCVSPGAGVPQQLQAIQVHPNTQSPSNNDSSPEISHASTNSTGKSGPHSEERHCYIVWFRLDFSFLKTSIVGNL